VEDMIKKKINRVDGHPEFILGVSLKAIKCL
jgi:hypothetical protein